jgi:putative ABC transport system permease protein
MGTLLQDIRYGFRILAKKPGLTTAMVLTLSLGIGAGTAIFSVVDKVLLRPLPLTDAGRLLTIREADVQRHRAPGVSGSVIQQLLEFTDTFEELTAYQNDQLALVREGAPTLIWGYEVTPNFFSWFRAKPLLGRTFAPGEGIPGSLDVVVLNYGFWKREFGGDPDIIGKSIPLSNETFVFVEERLVKSFTVIGVMPRQFQFPSAHWGQDNPDSYWVPRDVATESFGPLNRWVRNWTVLARPQTNVHPAQVEAVLRTLAAHNATEYPQTSKDWSFEVRPMNRLFWTADFRLTVASLAGAICIVLFLACANVANLLLAQMENRNREFAIRAAVGAGQWRLSRQLLTESVVLAMLGGAAGLLVAVWGLHVLSAHLPAELPRLREITLDRWAFGFAMLLAVITGILFGLVLAWRVSRMGPSGMLRDAGYGYTAGRERRLFQRGLVVTQIALTLVLLFGAGLMLQSVSRFLHVEPGYNPKNLLMFMVTHFNVGTAERNTKLNQLREAFEALPGVLSVTVSTHGSYASIEQADHSAPLTVQHTLVGVQGADYFNTWGIPLKRGRSLHPSDAGGSAIVVNESMARTLWPGEEPVGQWFQPANRPERCQVVGVVGDTVDNPERGPQLRYYEPYERAGGRGSFSHFTLKTATDPITLIPAIRKALWQIDRTTIPPEMMLPEGTFAALVQPRKTFLRFLGFFAVVGLALAAIGVYGVLAHLVACRTHEIGVRMALGATKASVLVMALRQGVLLIIAGLAIGSLGSFVATRLIQSKLFGVGATDPLTFISVCVLLTSVGLIACYIPARRATKVDPMVALRHE